MLSRPVVIFRGRVYTPRPTESRAALVARALLERPR